MVHYGFPFVSSADDYHGIVEQYRLKNFDVNQDIPDPDDDESFFYYDLDIENLLRDCSKIEFIETALATFMKQANAYAELLCSPGNLTVTEFRNRAHQFYGDAKAIRAGKVSYFAKFLNDIAKQLEERSDIGTLSEDFNAMNDAETISNRLRRALDALDTILIDEIMPILSQEKIAAGEKMQD